MAAQPPHPHGNPPLGALLLPHDHTQPIPPTHQSTAEITFDATSLGSQLVLDKGWRVGITANPAADNPDFDDSAWAVRDAKESVTTHSLRDSPKLRGRASALSPGFDCISSSLPSTGRFRCSLSCRPPKTQR
jgi:hypothetical protein